VEDVMTIRKFLDNYQKTMHIDAGYTYPENSDYGFYRETENGEIFHVYNDFGENVFIDDDSVLDAEM
jgi:hypothetical protein